MAADALLEVRDLRVEFDTDDGVVHAVDGVSYSVERGRALGIVGESRSGKSVSNLTVMGLTRFQGARISGEVTYNSARCSSTAAACSTSPRTRCGGSAGTRSR